MFDIGGLLGLFIRLVVLVLVCCVRFGLCVTFTDVSAGLAGDSAIGLGLITLVLLAELLVDAVMLLGYVRLLPCWMVGFVGFVGLLWLWVCCDWFGLI